MSCVNAAKTVSGLRTIKFMLVVILAVAAFGLQAVAWAGVGDSMAEMAQKYGRPILIDDASGYLWTAEEWQALPGDKQSVRGYGYGSSSRDINYTIWEEYDRQNLVKKETYIFDGSIRVRDFNEYFPELYRQLTAPQTRVFIIPAYPRDELGLLLGKQAGTCLFFRFIMDNNSPDKTKINMHSRIKAFEVSELTSPDSNFMVRPEEHDQPICCETWVRTANFFRPELYFSEKLVPRRTTDLIVIHHTGIENMSLADIHEMHLKNGWAGIGYHKVILPDGTVENGRPENMIGAHALGVNERSIGIVLVGDFETHGPTSEQMKALTILTLQLMQKYNIPVENVVPHRDVTPGTICPGPMFPWSQFIQGLKAADH